MPRLTNQHYLARHAFLRDAWPELSALYATIPYPQQLDVHEYYQPSKTLTSEQLLAHRAAVTKEDPSLPNRASKAATRMHKIYLAALEQAKGDPVLLHQLISSRTIKSAGPIRDGKQITVAAVARPELDLSALARVLLEIAENMTHEQRAEMEAKMRKDSKRGRAA